jgi:hypothetical protein
MESLFGRENMAREAAVVRMVQAYENELHQAAKDAFLVSQSSMVHPAWYCPMLVRLGGLMVSFGTYLKSRYAIDDALDAP